MQLNNIKENKTMNRKMLIAGTVLAVVAMQGAFGALNLPRLDSSQFDYKYEMEPYLTSVDVDGDGFDDFTTNANIVVSAHYGSVEAIFPRNSWFQSTEDSGQGCAWRKFVSKLDGDGYTIELRAKLGYMSTDQSWAYGLAASDTSGCDMILNFKSGALTWYNTTITNMDTTDAFHTYRVAKIPGQARFALWCDGVLVKDDLGDAVPARSDLNRLLLGAIGGVYGGSAYLSSLRFTKGAYAPPKEKDMRRDSSDFDIKYEMDELPASFVANGAVTASGSGGVMSFDFGTSSGGYYADSIWTNSFWSQARSYGYTMEIRAKVKSAEGRGIAISTSDSTTYDLLFKFGTDKLLWVTRNDSNQDLTITNMTTTADFHTYRVAKVPDADQFMLWCDGNLVTDTLTDAYTDDSLNRFLFGRIGGGYGGKIDVDYIRYTSGVHYPPVPPPGVVIMVF